MVSNIPQWGGGGWEGSNIRHDKLFFVLQLDLCYHLTKSPSQVFQESQEYLGAHIIKQHVCCITNIVKTILFSWSKSTQFIYLMCFPPTVPQGAGGGSGGVQNVL